MEMLVWLVVYGVELLFLAAIPRHKIHRLLAIITLVAGLITTSLLYGSLPLLPWLLLLFFMLFRLFNLLRVAKSRMHIDYLRRATFRTGIAVGLMSGIALLIIGAFTDHLQYLPYLQMVVAAGVFIITVKNIRKLRFKLPATYLVDRELPTVSVAIPARNETQDLQECLDALLASDYPKLEILVLDDCSQDKTAEIIRSYANKGIRFVQGDPPAERWLAKNQAYEKLYQEASGEYILFCGVDVRFGRQAIRSMLNVLHSRNKAMLSVLPVRDRSTPASAFIQPMRYWWELALPRRLFQRPPVLSTCWLINRKRLKKLGSFAAVSHTILPEGFFARELIKTDEYSFIRSTGNLAVRTVKSLEGQKDTAVRTLYPKIRRRPENALVLTVINLVFLLGPFISLIAGIWFDDINMMVSALAAALLVATHVSIVFASDPPNVMQALLTLPFAVIVETIIGYISMIGYEFGTITWKQRNICIPVMHVVRRLPKID